MPTTAPRISSAFCYAHVAASATLMWTAFAWGAEQLPEPTARINAFVEKQWNDFGLKPSPRATEGEWCRRLYLHALGRIPSVAELRSFQEDRGRAKRSRLVESLLYGERHAAEFADNWATIWTNLLIGRDTETERNSMVSRDGMHDYLHEAFRENRPYDRLVHELITAEGESVPGRKNFNGAVNFLATKLDEKAVLATAQTAKLFLGKQLQCTQCHNHPFNSWKQNQFWELSAFFRQTVALRRFDSETGYVRFIELTDQDFPGEGNTPAEAEVYFQQRQGNLVSAYPVFLDGTELSNRSGYLEDVHRRRELGTLITSSPDLPRAIVNRMWGHFFTYGFTTPVDDMGPHNPPSHPQLLDYLASEFARHGHDLKELITWIALSEPYALSSRATRNNTQDDPTQGERPLFSRFYLRQMRAEELYESLLVATAADKVHRGAAREETRRAWLEQFTIAFGTDEQDAGTTFNGSITQMLTLFNGDLMHQALSMDPGGVLHRVVQAEASFPAKVHYLFQAALAREATRTELDAARYFLGLRGGNVTEALQDVWWAVLNSNEFILNH